MEFNMFILVQSEIIKSSKTSLKYVLCEKMCVSQKFLAVK